MERKFKVGDRVKDIRTGRNGEIKSLTYSGYDKAHCVWVEFKFIHNGEQAFTNKSYRIDGSELDKGVCLHHIDPPAPVLTEWQEKKLLDAMKYGTILSVTRDEAIRIIKSILSEPEPPKWVPKEGEVCLFRDSDQTTWVGLRFTKMDGDRYLAKRTAWNQCRPFSIDLIGTTDNPKF